MKTRVRFHDVRRAALAAGWKKVNRLHRSPVWEHPVHGKLEHRYKHGCSHVWELTAPDGSARRFPSMMAAVEECGS